MKSIEETLLLKARDVLGFDQFPSPEQCEEMVKVRQEIADYLNAPDPWLEEWKQLEAVMKSQYRR